MKLASLLALPAMGLVVDVASIMTKGHFEPIAVSIGAIVAGVVAVMVVFSGDLD